MPNSNFSTDSPDFIKTIIDISETAGQAIQKIYISTKNKTIENQTITYKKDASPLTEADLISHKIISEALKKFTPQVPIISEENLIPANLSISKNYFWLVDPLDGTKEFIEKNDEFTVNIALIKKDYPIFGVIFAPALNKTYWGGSSIGAYRKENEEITSLKITPAPDKLRILASKNHLNIETQDFIDKIGKHELRKIGSSLKFCSIAEGNADIYPRLGPTSEWDTAAAQAILEGAGGYVKQLNGSPLVYGKLNILNPPFIAASIPWEHIIRV